MPPIEQRVVSSQKIGQKIGGGSAPAPVAAPAPAEKPGRRRGRLLLVLGIVVVLLAAGAAAYLLLVRDDAGAAPAVEPTPEPGQVLQVDPVSLNLQDGHYLRIGLGLQLTEDVGEAPDPSRALDLAIALFSGRTVAEVSDPTTREQLRDELADQLAEAYDGEVMGVYLTNYVTQ